MPLPLLAAAALSAGTQFGLSKLLNKKTKAPKLPMPNVPGLGDMPTATPLFKFSEGRMRGEGLGFGPGYLDKTVNPAATGRMTRLREQTIPTISNQASARGLGRSSIVQDQIGKADRDAQQDVDELMAKFFHLEQVQQKADLSEGVGVQQDLLGKAIGLQTQRNAYEAGIPLQQAQLDQAATTDTRTGEAAIAEGLGPLINRAFGVPSETDIWRDILTGKRGGGKAGSASVNLPEDEASAYSMPLKELFAMYQGGM